MSARKGERLISIYNIHTKEKIRVIYKKNGKYQPRAMAKINHIMRDWRRNEVIKIDPKLVDLMWEVYTEVGSRKPIYLISGYRSQKTNSMLRKQRGGQARRSQHTLGRAADIHFPDVSVRRLRYSALIRERGGVGYYPTSALPFVHLDTGRVRHWPRMPRVELAALFPNGRSKHIPRDGKPITKRDYKIAMAKLNERKKRMIQQARYEHRSLQRDVQPQLASLTAPTPLGARREKPKIDVQPKPKPKIVAKSRPKAPPPLPQRKTQLAALTPDVKTSKDANTSPRVNLAPDPEPPAYPAWQNAKDLAEQYRALARQAVEEEDRWARAPSFDDEHPDELSYQPFPVLPFMKDLTVSFDVDVMAFQEPDYTSTDSLYMEPVDMIPIQFRQGLQFAEMLWATRFKGSAVVNILPEDKRNGIAEKSPQKRVVRN